MRCVDRARKGGCTGSNGILIAAAIADDLTGAQEMGALLASHGLRTAVMLDPRRYPSDVEAVVFDTESRHVSAGEACRRIREAASLLPASLPVSRVFKKIDSTMRGNVHVEVMALSEALGNAPVLLTPAYPAFGRTVVDGALQIDGVPVAQTYFAQDPKYWVIESKVPGAVDASTDSDLEDIAACATALLAGSGGLGRAWARGLPQGAFTPPHLRASRPLLVCGSAHPISRAQIQRAGELGIPVLATPAGPGSADSMESEVARQASAAIRAARPDLLIIFGGQTAYRVLRGVCIEMLHPVFELCLGIPVSTAMYCGSRMTVVTKAGGFGEPADVDRIMEQFT